jgi:hypothetical protein
VKAIGKHVGDVFSAEEFAGIGIVKNAHVIERHNAKIAQLVEHDLAKVGVAGSSPVFRST